MAIFDSYVKLPEGTIIIASNPAISENITITIAISSYPYPITTHLKSSVPWIPINHQDIPNTFHGGIQYHILLWL